MLNKTQTKIIIVDCLQHARNEYIVRAKEHVTVILLAAGGSIDGAYTIRLVGLGARATIVGVAIGKKEEHISIHTMQRHEAPGTTSDLLVKSVLLDQSQLFYTGSIRVEKIAQKTDAYQRNENLLLSEHARAESKPALEILANDVRCTHGATISSLSSEHLWYLQTRGIAPEIGKDMLVDGFFHQGIERIFDTMAKKKVQAFIRRNMYG